MAEDDISLKQKNALGVELQIKLIGGRELQVGSKKGKTKRAYSVDILSLQDKSKKVISIAWKWLFISIVFFVFTMLMLKILPPYLNDNKNLYLGLILLSGVVAGLLSLVQFWKHSSRKQIFYSRNANIPIIELSVGRPTKSNFNDFVNKVEERVKKFRSHMDIAEDKQLIGEMKMLRRLSDDGIISNKLYEAAKTKLFKGFDSQVVNRDA